MRTLQHSALMIAFARHAHSRRQGGGKLTQCKIRALHLSGLKFSLSGFPLSD